MKRVEASNRSTHQRGIQRNSPDFCPRGRTAPVENKQSDGAKKRKLFLSIATVAAAGFSGVMAAPANASSTTAEGGTDVQARSIAAPYSEEEIRTLQQLGDFLGAGAVVRMIAGRVQCMALQETHRGPGPGPGD